MTSKTIERSRCNLLKVLARHGFTTTEKGWPDELVEDDSASLLRGLSFWKALQGLEESTSESEFVVAGFACKGRTANAVTAAGLRLLSRFGIQP